jgi:hypothetical protein
MNLDNLHSLRFPLGEMPIIENSTDEQRQIWINDIEILPKKLRETAHNLSLIQLATPYREGGWTARQVVHHLADSHINAYIRFKLALTEENPTIRPYMEDRWATLQDSNLPIEISLHIIEGIHARWTHLLRGMTSQDFQRTYVHPEHGKVFSLGAALGMYAWHGRHHIEHIKMVK